MVEDNNKDKIDNPFDNIFPYKEEEKEKEEKEDDNKHTKKSSSESKKDHIKKKENKNQEKEEKEEKEIRDNIVEETTEGVKEGKKLTGFEELLDIGEDTIALESEEKGKEEKIETKAEESKNIKDVMDESVILKDENNKAIEDAISKDFDIESGKGFEEEIPKEEFIEKAPEEVAVFESTQSKVETLDDKELEPQKKETNKIPFVGPVTEITPDKIDTEKVSTTISPVPTPPTTDNLSIPLIESLKQLNDTISGFSKIFDAQINSIGNNIKEIAVSINKLSNIDNSINEFNKSLTTKETELTGKLDDIIISLNSIKNVGEELDRINNSIGNQSSVFQSVADTSKSTEESIKKTNESIGTLIENESALLDARKQETNINLGLKHNDNGVYLYYNGKYDSAINEFLKSLEYYPDNYDCLNNLALSYLKMNNIDKAINNAEKAIQMSQDSFTIHNTLGLIYLQSKEYTKAEGYFNKASQLNSNYVSPYINLGYLYKDTDKYDKAIELWQKALDLDPTNIDLKNKLEELKEGTISE
jgi:tetratricopeptide (TPR) repeat protein